MNPTISVIVPVRNDRRIDELLVSLAAQEHAPEFEVVVALDGATRRPRVPPGLGARLLDLPARGPYAARNAAVRVSSGDLLLFTDSDCLCPRDWIAKAVRLLADPRVAALQGSSRPRDDSRLSRFIQLEYDRYVASHEATGFRLFCNTRNFAIRAEIARELPLPESLPRGGDAIYGQWLAKREINIHYEPAWWIAHQHPRSRWEEGRRAFALGRNGALWGLHANSSLFQATARGAPRGPGAWLVSQTRGGTSARTMGQLLLFPVIPLLAFLSVVLPERAGARAFSRFRRAAHLAGRLSGEARAAQQPHEHIAT